MKYLIIILVLMSSLIYCQSKNIRGGEFEIYTEVREGTARVDFVKFELYNAGKIWENTNTSIIPLTEEFNYAHACENSNYEIVNIPTPTPDNGWEYGIFHTASFAPGNYPSSSVVFGNGKYKIKITENTTGESFYFYLDYTTDNYTYGGDNDIWVKYYIDSNTVKVKWGNADLYHSIDKGKTFKIWEKKGEPRSTEKLELYLTMTNQNNHPYLEWNAYHDPNIIGYYLYRVRKYGSTVKFPLNSSTTSYLDADITMGTSHDVYVSYWVTARLNSSTESLSGNTVKTEGQYLPQKISTNNESKEELRRFRLSANYPNPFNPSTTISYQIPQKGNVTLKIYNTLGEEISTLVNETKERGVYSVIFNAENLPSGIYIYKITAGKFSEVRKMQLIK